MHQTRGMGRKLRVQYPGAIYHVMNRGDRREPIFQDDLDRQRFLQTLAEACAKTDWQMHAWCSMGNHFHLAHGRAAAPCVGLEQLYARGSSRLTNRWPS